MAKQETDKAYHEYKIKRHEYRILNAKDSIKFHEGKLKKLNTKKKTK